MNKEVNKRLDALEAYVSEEMEKIRKLAKDNSNKEVKLDLFSITTYDEVCIALKEDKEVCPYKQIKQIEKLFNGDWKVNLKDNTQKRYYPYFGITPRGLVFTYSIWSDYFFGRVGLYKDEKTSDHIGKYFINIYENLYS